MAKKKKIDSLNASLEATLKQFKAPNKQEQKELLKEAKKESKKALNKYNKTQNTKDYFDFIQKKNRVENLGKSSDKIHIKYGNFDFDIKREYFDKLKDKERYLDNLYNRKMKNVLSKQETPKTEGEAKEVQALLKLYSKKVGERDFFDKGLYKNIRNKLKKFQNEKLTEFTVDEELSESGEDVGEMYEAVEIPVVLDDFLVGINFNFF